ncbi:cytochrome c [Octadecabacter sp. CECT 8868]|uniref:c-type cytochrome n=1 Tax=Octadecabacter algicola TaxID=2909342 RepID=UPI001F2B4D87|nr:cytochrome c [Octadecabacter algicola]MCF2903937.1 cytochrome c [Octadecabacter algicola]
MKSLSLLAGTAVLAVATIATAHADEDMHPTVVARHAQMQLYAYNVGILGGMAQGKIDYDAEAAQTAADNMVALTSMNTASFWPEGTAEGTKAQPAIWENLDDFMSKGEDLAFEAQGMADVAGNDLASLQGAMGNLGGTCSACHREYRAR